MAGYINGDAVEFTGEVRQLHGGEFRVFRWLEGVKVGQEGVTAQQAEQQAAAARLRELVKPGDTVYTVLRRVSASGMSREISLHVIIDNEPYWITGLAARAMGDRTSKRDGIIVGGCGMDMGFHLVYNLGRTLWRDGVPCAGGRCMSNDHSNGDRDRSDTTKVHNDGGYALQHRWL